MRGPLDIELARQRREELLREAAERRLARSVRGDGRGGADGRFEDSDDFGGVVVRWGLTEDEAAVAELLELNGMPRWVAYEERFIVAERDGRVLGALRYRTESKRLLLGLLVVDPWAGEGRVARALYAGAADLARELGVRAIIARSPAHGVGYPREAGYRRRGRREWRLDVVRSGKARDEPVAGRWRRLVALFGATAVPFVGILRKQG